MSILTVEGLKKTYIARFDGAAVEALKNVSFSVESGEYVAIMGESGSGKTTLLNILAALDKPTAGKVVLDGMKLSDVKEKELASFRREHLGFVFQEFNLLDTLNVKDNTMNALIYLYHKTENYIFESAVLERDCGIPSDCIDNVLENLTLLDVVGKDMITINNKSCVLYTFRPNHKIIAAILTAKNIVYSGAYCMQAHYRTTPFLKENG